MRPNSIILFNTVIRSKRAIVYSYLRIATEDTEFTEKGVADNAPFECSVFSVA